MRYIYIRIESSLIAYLDFLHKFMIITQWSEKVLDKVEICNFVNKNM